MENPSSESIPDLTDVLHALTGCNELLMSKVRDVRREHPDAVGTTGEVSPHVEFLEIPDQRLPAHPGPHITSVAPQARAAEGMDTGTPEMDADTVREPAMQDVVGEVRHPEPTEGDSPDRNYNFFDDLDTRLAHLEPPATGSGER